MTSSTGTIHRTIGSLAPEIAGRYPYASRFADANGWRIHYIDQGARDAPPVLLLHGSPTWGYLWRETIPPLLTAGYRVVVPDQIGFGLSEHPHASSAHTLDNHVANLVALIEHLDLTNTLFALHDWGGPTGLSALLTRPHRAAAVAVMSTWSWAAPSAAFHRRVVPWRLMHAPLIGPYLLGRHGAMPGRGSISQSWTVTATAVTRKPPMRPFSTIPMTGASRGNGRAQSRLKPIPT